MGLIDLILFNSSLLTMTQRSQLIGTLLIFPARVLGKNQHWLSSSRSREENEKPREVFNDGAESFSTARLIDNNARVVIALSLILFFFLPSLARKNSRRFPKRACDCKRRRARWQPSRVIHLPSRGRPVTLLGTANGPRQPTARKTFFLFTRGRAMKREERGVDELRRREVKRQKGREKKEEEEEAGTRRCETEARHAKGRRRSGGRRRKFGKWPSSPIPR